MEAMEPLRKLLQQLDLPFTERMKRNNIYIFFIQGAVVVINEIEGTESAVIRGVIIGLAAIVAIVFSLIKNKNLTSIGFRKPVFGV